MKLLPAILLSTLLPLILVVAVSAFQIGNLLDRLDNTIQKELLIKKAAIINSFEESLKQSSQIVKILTNTQLTASSLEINDTEELYELGRKFIVSGIDYISFVNVRGTIVARGHSDSEFGDDFSGYPLIQGALNQQTNTLITHFDNGTYLLSLAPVLKYDEYVVGAVVVGTLLDDQLVEKFSKNHDVGISVYQKNSLIASSIQDHSLSDWDTISFKYQSGIRNDLPSLEFTVNIYENNIGERYSLIKLRRNIILFAGFFIFIICIIIYFLVDRIVKPIRIIVNEMYEYSKGNRLKTDLPIPKNEIGDISRAFSEMRNENTDLVNSLEDRVAERTKDLESANLDLYSVLEELKISKAKAETANKAKSIFLANMSHELRTPLNAVTGFSELLSSMLSNGRQKSYVNSIKTAGKSLLTLINDILDLSKIEAGKIEIHVAPIDLKTLFSETEQIFKLKAQEKNVKFIVEYKSDIPSSLFLDETRIRQILLNLVGNAVKFTDEGQIKLIANVLFNRDNHEQLDLFILVEDTGIGINFNDQNKIFDSFEQQSNQNINKYGGTGLGLTITKRLVETMGGHIELKSIPNEGSTFTIILNNVQISSSETPAVDEDLLDIDQIIFYSSKILVVDDIASNRELLTELLTKVELKVISAHNGQEAVMMAETLKPDLILMDIRMPVMNGMEAAIKLKQNPETLKIPVIALTASAGIYDKEKIKEIGIDGYLTKPIRISKLLTELTRFLKFTRKEKNQKETIERENSPKNKIWNLPELQSILQNEILPQIESELGGATNVTLLTELSERLIERGKKHKTEALIRSSENLHKFAESFEIDGMTHALIDLHKVIKFLINQKIE